MYARKKHPVMHMHILLIMQHAFYIYIFKAFYSINYFIKLKENVRDDINRPYCQ